MPKQKQIIQESLLPTYIIDDEGASPSDSIVRVVSSNNESQQFELLHVAYERTMDLAYKVLEENRGLRSVLEDIRKEIDQMKTIHKEEIDQMKTTLKKEINTQKEEIQLMKTTLKEEIDKLSARMHKVEARVLCVENCKYLKGLLLVFAKTIAGKEEENWLVKIEKYCQEPCSIEELDKRKAVRNILAEWKAEKNNRYQIWHGENNINNNPSVMMIAQILNYLPIG